MATSNEPNIAAMASIIAACIAATPPTLTVATDIATKLRGLLQEKQGSPPRVLKITREPVDANHWRKVRGNFLISIFLLLAGILFILTNTLLYRFGFQYIKLTDFGVIGTLLGFKINILIVVNLVFLCFYLLAFVKAYRRMGNRAEDARHFLFKKASLLVESDFQSTINRCQETLKLLGARVIEFNLETKIIEAYTNQELVSFWGGLYRIRINTEDFKSAGIVLEVEFFPYVSDKISKLTKSSNVNRFVRVFING
jgi:uncharacterized membrane protein